MYSSYVSGWKCASCQFCQPEPSSEFIFLRQNFKLDKKIQSWSDIFREMGRTDWRSSNNNNRRKRGRKRERERERLSKNEIVECLWDCHKQQQQHRRRRRQKTIFQKRRIWLFHEQSVKKVFFLPSKNWIQTGTATLMMIKWQFSHFYSFLSISPDSIRTGNKLCRD